MGSTASGFVPEEMQYHLAHFILLVVSSGFATTSVVLRFWARKILNQALALHDYLILLGLVFALAETGVNVYACCFPVPRKIDTVSEELSLQLLFLSPVLWITAVTIIRAAIVVLYIQIFPIQSSLIASYAALVVNAVFGASAVIADCLICRPITYRWAPTMVGGSCGDQKFLDMYIAIFNLLLDVMVVILPMPILWRLQMARSKKMALSFILGIGIMICAITMYRVQITSTIGDPTNLHAQDTYCRIALLTSLEALLGVISACLPMFKPLLHKLQGSQFERGANSIKSSISGSVPVVMRRNRMPLSSSREQYISDRTSMPQSLGYEMDVEGKCEDQGSLRQNPDRTMESGITGKPHFRDADAESMVSDV